MRQVCVLTDVKIQRIQEKEEEPQTQLQKNGRRIQFHISYQVISVSPRTNYWDLLFGWGRGAILGVSDLLFWGMGVVISR